MFTFKNNKKDPVLIDAQKIIIGIGLTAIAFPLAVHIAAGNSAYCADVTLHSISAYFHTDARYVFVGMICALAFSFFAYNGIAIQIQYFQKLRLCVFWGWLLSQLPFLKENIPDGSYLREIAHIICAVVLLLIMAVFSIYIFTHRDEGEEISKGKLRLYRVFDYIILGSLLLIAIYYILHKKGYGGLEKQSPIFWLESICLVAFGCSWLLKSKLYVCKEGE